MLRASDVFGAPAGAIGVKRKLTERSAKSKAALPMPPSASVISGLLTEADDGPAVAQPTAKAKPTLPRPASAALITDLLTEADQEPFAGAQVKTAARALLGGDAVVGDTSESARLVDAALRAALQPDTAVQAPKPEKPRVAKKETWHKIPRGHSPKVGATIAVRKAIKYKEYELKPGMRGVVQKVHADGHAKVKWKSFGTQYLLKANFDSVATKVEEEEDPPTDLEGADAEPSVNAPDGDAASVAAKALSWLEQAASAEKTGQASVASMAIPAARPGWSVVELVTEWTAVQAQVQEHLRVTQAYAAQMLPAQHQRHVEMVSKAQEEARVALLRWLAGKEEALKALHVQTSHLGYAELMLLPAQERQHGASLQTMVRAVVAQEAAGLPSTSGWLFQWLSGLGQATLAQVPQAHAPAPTPAPAPAPAASSKPPMLLSKAKGLPPGRLMPSPSRPSPSAADQQAQEDAILARNLRGALSHLPEYSKTLLAKAAAAGGDTVENPTVLKWTTKSRVL